MDHTRASELAKDAVNMLMPYTRRIEIAGSIRRKKLDGIKDIEIVCEPKIISGSDRDLFGNANSERDMLYETFGNLKPDRYSQDFPFLLGMPDKAGKKAPSGPKYYRLQFRGEPLDLFAVLPPATWGTVFLIRTGDSDFSHKFVTKLWDHGLRSKDGHIERSSDGLVIDTPEEKDAFKACHLDYIEPEKRNSEAIS